MLWSMKQALGIFLLGYGGTLALYTMMQASPLVGLMGICLAVFGVHLYGWHWLCSPFQS